MNSAMGQTVGNYTINGFIGAGGMGNVYRAEQIYLKTAAAIKVMHSSLEINPDFQTRFLHEAQALAALKHRNIVSILDFGRHDLGHYLVMELVMDGSLRSLLKERRSAAEQRPLLADIDLVRQAATGLAYAHGKGMVHRDVKPDNLLLSRDDPEDSPHVAGYTLKVSDFGLVRWAEGGSVTAAGMTAPGMVMGSYSYMSPEQVQGQNLDARSDIYSLGIVLYEVLSGHVPFQTDSFSQAWNKHVLATPPPLREIRPELPEEIEALVQRCLAKVPDDRFPSMTALIGELDRAISQGPLAGLTAVGPTQDLAQLGTAVDVLAPTLPPPTQIEPRATQVDAPPTGKTVPPPVISDGREAAPATPAEPVTIRPVLPPTGQTLPPTPPTMFAPAHIPRVAAVDRTGKVVQTVDLTGEGVSVGRIAGNAMVLPDSSVSRHHAQIDWDGQQVTVTDLGTSNGTLLDGVRLKPNTSTLWSPEQWLRAGPYWLKLELPGDLLRAAGDGATPAVPDDQTVPVSTISSRIRVLLDKDEMTLTPGQPAVARVLLANLGSTVDHLSVTAEGVPESWVKRPETPVQLNPGAQATALLTVTVGRIPENKAGPYDVMVRARSRENPSESGTAPSVWTVLPFSGAELSLSPSKARGWRKAHYRIRLRNTGNAPMQYTWNGNDEERRFAYQFGESKLSLPPGETSNSSLTVQAPWRWIGTAQTRPFTVSAPSTTDEKVYTAAGTFVQRALIPPWLPPLLALGAIGVVLLLRSMQPGPAVVPDPVISQFQANPASVLPHQAVLISWQAKHATKFRLSLKRGGANNQSIDLNKRVRQYAIRPWVGTTVELIAFNGIKHAQESISVAILPTPTPKPTATPKPPPPTAAPRPTSTTASGGPQPTKPPKPTAPPKPQPKPTKVHVRPPPPRPTNTPRPAKPTPTPKPPAPTPIPAFGRLASDWIGPWENLDSHTEIPNLTVTAPRGVVHLIPQCVPDTCTTRKFLLWRPGKAAGGTYNYGSEIIRIKAHLVGKRTDLRYQDQLKVTAIFQQLVGGTKDVRHWTFARQP